MTTRPTWAFDDSPIPDPMGYGERAVKFFGALRHPKSDEPDGKVRLPRFWERVVRRIEGPRDDRGRRIVRTAFIMIPRGARKTTIIGGGLGLLHAVGHERRPHGQALLAAGAEDQAELAFDEAAAMVKATPALKRAVKIRSDYLEHDKAESTLRVLSADGDVSHGKTPHFVALDELHIWRNRRLWKALRTGMLKVSGTLLIITTTAGRGQAGLCWDEYQYASRVARGEIDNPSYLPVILEPEESADWQDERVWHFVNPGLDDGYPDLDAMRAAAFEASEKPADRDDFKQYNLNFWLDQSLSPFVDMHVYDDGAKPIDLASLKGRKAWLGCDMSSTTDLSALVLAFCGSEAADDGGYTVLAHFFIPGNELAKRAERDKAPYPLWAEHGYLTATPGDVIDYDAIVAKAREWAETYELAELGFDRAYAQPVMGPLMQDGLPVITLQQGWVTQSPAVRELERAIVARRFRHGGNPVLRMCFENIAVHTDSNNNKTFHKGRSRGRIDGASAAWMAISRAAAGNAKGSIYDHAEVWDTPAAPAAVNDDGQWSSDILNDPQHPLFAEHRQRFEEWQDLQGDDE